MADAEDLLARARLRLRRATPGWAQPTRVESRSEHDLESIAFRPHAWVDPASGLPSREELGSASAESSNRLESLKRISLPGLASFVERQVRINRRSAGALRGHARWLVHLANAGDALKRASAERLGELDQKLGGLGADVRELGEALPRGRDDARAQTAHEIERLGASIDALRRELEGPLAAVRAQAEAARSEAAAAREEVGALRGALANAAAGLAQAQEELARRRRGVSSARWAALQAPFEARFGDAAADRDRRFHVYVPRIAACAAQAGRELAFLDLGCGRGEFVAALRRAGVAAEGVETSSTLADACEASGVPVQRADLFAALRGRADASLAGVSALGLLEHLELDALLELIELASAKLAAGGVLLLEAIDVRTPYALRRFYANPNRQLPLVPETLRFLVEAAGFAAVEGLALEPVPEPIAPGPGGGDHVERIASALFGPQCFAVLARRPPVPEPPRRRAGTRRRAIATQRS